MIRTRACGHRAGRTRADTPDYEYYYSNNYDPKVQDSVLLPDWVPYSDTAPRGPYLPVEPGKMRGGWGGWVFPLRVGDGVGGWSVRVQLYRSVVRNSNTVPVQYPIGSEFVQLKFCL